MSEENPDQPKAPRKARPRKWAYMHMRTTRGRRGAVLGLLRHFSTDQSPATLTHVVESVFDEGLAALKSRGVSPDSVGDELSELSPSEARVRILRAAGFSVEADEEESEADEPASAGPAPMHLTRRP